MDHRGLPSLETFEDAIYNDAPNCFRSDCLRDGSPTQAQDSPFEAKHRCSRKSGPAPVCIEFEREIRVRTVPNPGRVDFIRRSSSAYPYTLYIYVCVCALLTRNIDRQPSSVTRDPTVASSFESSMLRLVYPRRGTVDDPMTPKATRRFPSPTFLHVSRIVFVSDSSNPRSSSPRFLSSRK